MDSSYVFFDPHGASYGTHVYEHPKVEWMVYPMYVRQNYSGHLVEAGRFSGGHHLFYGEKVGADFLARRPSGTHRPLRAPSQPYSLLSTMPSILAGCCTHRGTAAP